MALGPRERFECRPIASSHEISMGDHAGEIIECRAVMRSWRSVREIMMGDHRM